MKRIVSIALFIFLIFPYLGLFSWLHYQKKLVRKEVKRKLIAGLKKEELTLLKFSKKEAQQLEWKHSKEFKYKEQFYDVVDTKIIQDSIYYYCWWDNEETILSKKLDTLLAQFHGKNHQKKTKCKSLISFFKSLYYQEVEAYNISFLSYSIFFNYQENNYVSPNISSPGPPPKAI